MTGIKNSFSIIGLFCLALAAATIAALHAGLTLRDFEGDGVYYIQTANGLNLIEPGRKTVQFLQQSLVLAGFKLGSTDILAYGRLLTFAMQGWPVLLTALCWPALPRGEKNWILGPLINLAVVIPATSFVGIGEGMIASCIMWLLFLLVEFDGPGWIRRVAALLLALACFAVHEASFLFMGFIAYLAAARAYRQSGLRRICDVGVSLLALLDAIHLFNLVLVPRDPTNRGAFLQSLFSDAWVAITAAGWGINLPAFAGLGVAACLALVHFPRARSAAQRAQTLQRASLACLAFFLLVAGLYLAIPEWVALPQNFFAARGFPIMATMLMAYAIFQFRRFGWQAETLTPPPVRTVLAAIIALNLLVQTVLTLHWDSYRNDLAALVASRQGVIGWNKVSAALNPQRTFFRNDLARSWIIQPLSIALAPRGRVRAMVDARPDISWKPYNPDDAGTLPLCAKGLNWDGYLAARGFPPAVCGR